VRFFLAATVAAVISAADPQPPLRLLGDPNADARRQAADSLAAIDDPSVVPALEAALRKESDPRVVDALITALRHRGAPPTDPEECRALVGRVWDEIVAAQMIDCWRPTARILAAPGSFADPAARDQVIGLALNGTVPERAAALVALAAPVARRTAGRSSIGAPPALEASVRDRLLEGAASTLSEPGAISRSSEAAVERAIWQLSGRSMPIALAVADRVTPIAARYRTSSAIANADVATYERTRRRGQLVVVLSIAAGLALLGLLRRARRAAWLLAAGVAAWAVWIMQATGARDLPPPPLQFVTVGALGCVGAGVVTAVVAALWPRGGGRAATAVGFLLTPAIAGAVAATVCFVTRSTKVFPSDVGRWELIFDPLGALILAVLVAIALLVVDAAVAERTAAGGTLQ